MQQPTIHTIVCPEQVIEGRLITKEKRQEMFGRVAGGKGSNRPEKYQREMIALGTGLSCPPTQVRLNWRKNTMVNYPQPMRINNKKQDGFDYTETFDGKQRFHSNTVWINLKSVVGTGGSQIRTLRECYHFIHCQLNYLRTIKANHLTQSTETCFDHCFFANVFDGDEASKKRKEFVYLLEDPIFVEVKNHVYVGDLRNYFAWIKENVCKSDEVL